MSQFVTEAVAISITGGIIGVIFGISLIVHLAVYRREYVHQTVFRAYSLCWCLWASALDTCLPRTRLT